MERNRRAFLRAIGASGLAALSAGCADLADDGSEATSTDEPTGESTSAPTDTPADSPTSTDSPTPTEVVEGPEEFQRTAAPHDMADGFAEVAPWLDDAEDVTVSKVTEPTREALAEAMIDDGPSVVVFETSGTIDLEGRDMTVPRHKTWIAGQTAPDPGITLVRGGFGIGANDCVVQHMRFRPGIAGHDEGWEPDALNTADDTENNVIDHCTATWGIDECLSVGYDSNDTTVTNCLIGRGLNDATHSAGPHAKGTLIGNRAKNVTLAGNLWAHNKQRNPRLKDGSASAVVNNVSYHFNMAIGIDVLTSASIVGNAFLRQTDDYPHVDGLTGQIYVEDNYADPEEFTVGENVETVDEPPLWPEDLEAYPAEDVESEVFAHVGARPASRTELDERIVEEARERTGEIIDSQEEDGGYPDLEENYEELEVPDTNLRNWLRQQARQVEP